jgi:very-short-patch-repair endonuclease
LREQVLRDLGWRLHRIWSTDWFRNPDRIIEAVLRAVERARQEPVERSVIAPPGRRALGRAGA